MAVNLNLLPPELAVSKSLGNIIKTVRALGVIGIAAFLVFGAGIGIFFIISTISLNGISSNIKGLEAQISAQKKSEQQIILLKNRIAKIATVLTAPSSLPSLTIFQPFLPVLSANTSIGQMAFNPKGSTISLSFGNSTDLSQFLNSIRSSSVFSSVNVTSFSFSPATGYLVEVKVINK
jgi:hypothetical protein